MEEQDDNYTDVDPPPPDDRPAIVDLGPGTEVGGYVIDGELGRGGMGVVYAATHPVIGKRAAIKVLRPSLSKNPVAVERFIQEARAVNQIGHPSIVDIFAFDRLPDGRAYLVMDLLVGESLRKRLRRGPLHLSEGASVIDEVAAALMAAHDKGFIHRDLKPDNVYLVPRDGRWPEVKLLDFGLAKLLQRRDGAVQTKTGVLLGTPDYMSPEQARGKEIDHRTDIYALGVLTFEILTGKRPFPKGETPLATLQAHAEQEPPSLADEMPSLPQEIAQLANAMLAKDPDDRPSLGAVRTVIKRLRSNTIIPTMSVASLEMSLPAQLPMSSAQPSELSLTAVKLGAEPLVPSPGGLDALDSVPTAPGDEPKPSNPDAKFRSTVPGAAPRELRPPSTPPISNPSIPISRNDDPRVSRAPSSGPIIVDIRQGPSPSSPPIDVRQLAQPASSQRFPSTVPGTVSSRTPTSPPSMSNPSIGPNPGGSNPGGSNPGTSNPSIAPPGTSNPSIAPANVSNPSIAPPNISSPSITPPAMPHGSHGPQPIGARAVGSNGPTATGSHPPGTALRGEALHPSTTLGVAPPFKAKTSAGRSVAKPPSRAWIAIVAVIVLAAGIAVALTQLR